MDSTSGITPSAALRRRRRAAPETFGDPGDTELLNPLPSKGNAKELADKFSMENDATAFDRTDRLIALCLTLLCLATRLYRVGRRTIVSWDETHFGKFGAFYINGTFYHDVHPPLAKMLVGLSEFVSGHNGSFMYSSGATYPDYVNYTFQRSFLAVLGALIVPFAYRTCRFLGFGRAAATMGALFVLLDNALCVISRFILLDPPLLCFTAMSLLAYAGFAAQAHRPFSVVWWRWLVFTGVSLGLTVSAKWVGLFVIALVGLCTVEELLRMYSDRRISANTQLAHWAARCACLIVLPAMVYLASFQIHFALLRSRGTGDFKMPSTFQALQRNSVVARQPHYVALGSQITLRSHLPGFGLIYSNDTNRFPDRRGEWVAAGMAGKQTNNWWQVVSATNLENNTVSPPQSIGDGALVRFLHSSTRRFLRTGTGKPYHQRWDRRVFAGGNVTDTSVWDLWRIHIIDEASSRPSSRVYSVTTRFQLFNALSGCLLQATPNQLPVWGRQLSELICTDANSTSAETTLWNVEQVHDKRLKRADFRQLVGRSLLRDTIWLNREMARSNNRLIPDPDRYKHTESDPWTWPLLLYPMRMVSWADTSIKYYEVGNPLLWWASTICCILYPLQMLFWLIRQHRQSSTWHPGEFKRFWDSSKLLWGGWALHYLPFFLMGRVTYIHHYLPALYFALLLLAFELQCFARWYLPRRAMWLFAGAISVAVGYVFILFSPLTFGWERPAKELAHLVWLSTWNIVKDRNVVV